MRREEVRDTRPQDYGVKERKVRTRKDDMTQRGGSDRAEERKSQHPISVFPLMRSLRVVLLFKLVVVVTSVPAERSGASSHRAC